jgi:TPR repeat protein
MKKISFIAFVATLIFIPLSGNAISPDRYEQGCYGNSMLCESLPLSNKSIIEIEKQCKSGKSLDCNTLGIRHVYGDNVSVDYFRAFSLFERACEGGNTAGCSNLGTSYSLGRGVRKDVIKALPYFHIGCNDGVWISCYQLGIAYKWGNGVNEDQKLAKEYFGKSCDLKSQMGCNAYSQY